MALYLEHCLEAVASINTEQLGNRTIGEYIGRGGDFAFYPIGELAVLHEVEYVGLKVPHGGDFQESNLRIVQEIAFISWVGEEEPRLLQYTPSFIGRMCVEGSDDAVIIMEDASRGASHQVQPASASSELRDLFFNSVVRYGSRSQVLDEETLDRRVAFRINGQERVLDLTPEPVPFRVLHGPAKTEYREISRRVFEHLEDLTITLPHDSPLAADIIQFAPKPS